MHVRLHVFNTTCMYAYEPSQLLYTHAHIMTCTHAYIQDIVYSAIASFLLLIFLIASIVLAGVFLPNQNYQSYCNYSDEYQDTYYCWYLKIGAISAIGAVS